MKTSDFEYELPESAIAQAAIEPRDSSRLLDTRTMTDNRFSDLPALLDAGDLLVVNRTRVSPMRLIGSKAATGGRVEALLLRPIGDGSWEALVRPARRLRSGEVIAFGATSVTLGDGPRDGIAVLVPQAGTIESAMVEVGSIPLPPYFHGTLDDDARYQTVYAERPGSAAAPTAGLHFTPAVLDRLAECGIEVAGIDLRVGLDTFRPITTELATDHEIHSEDVVVGGDTVEAIEATRLRGGRVVAVGTTVVRALETAAAQKGVVAPFDGPTRLFIVPGYDFKVVDLLITNFHVPASSLIVLVSAFMGDGWRTAYDTALERGYRFLSFGDAMLAERARP